MSRLEAKHISSRLIVIFHIIANTCKLGPKLPRLVWAAYRGEIIQLYCPNRNKSRLERYFGFSGSEKATHCSSQEGCAREVPESAATTALACLWSLRVYCELASLFGTTSSVPHSPLLFILAVDEVREDALRGLRDVESRTGKWRKAV